MRVKEKIFIKNNAFEIVYLSVILSGIVATTLLFLLDLKAYIFQQSVLVEIQGKMDFLMMFAKSFLQNSCYIAVLFMCGFSAVLQPIIFACGFFKGVQMAISILSLYQQNGINGIALSFVLIIIPSFFIIFALVVGGREAFNFSCNLAGAVFTEKNFIGLKYASKLYGVKFLILEAFVAIGVLSKCFIIFLLQ